MTQKERLRYFEVLLKLIPVAIRYRSDRNEIFRNNGRLVSLNKYRVHAKAAVESFIDLGPAFIKLGQLLSVRPDVLPQPYMDEFARLQDDVPPAPFDDAKRIIEEDIGPINKTFDAFDQEAVIGASLGQVYRAKYNGKDVVVKVNRPHIKEQLDVDTVVIKKLMPLVGKFIDKGLASVGSSIVEQFSETVMEEVDYEKERLNLIAIRRNLRNSDVLIPHCYEKVSTKRVLVLEYIEGIKITDIKSLDSFQIDRKELAKKVTKLYMEMMLNDDIFHADPHPGNISVKPGGKIILYDFGMTGRLDKETRAKLIRLYGAIARGSVDRIMDSLLDLGVLQPSANRYVIKRGIELVLSDMHGTKVEEADVRELMEVANRTIYQFPFKLPRNLVLYIRTISILDGITKMLDDQFNFIRYLGSVLRDEGLMTDIYLDELKYNINRIGQALNASLEIPQMLKDYLEINQNVNTQNNIGKVKFLWGAIAGISASSIIVSSFFIDKTAGILGFSVSLVIFIVTIFLQRR